MIKNERGTIFPIALVLTLIAIFLIHQASIAYVSQIGYVYGMRDYYKNELTVLLSSFTTEEDDSATLLHYNEIGIIEE